jgi:MipA family protein
MRYASRSTAPLFALATLGATFVTPRAAQAQTPAPDGCACPTWTGVVGIGAVTLPRYTGSDEYRVVAMPVVQLEYKGRYFLGGSQTDLGGGLGAYVVRRSSFTWQVAFDGSQSRPESRGDALAGMGKRAAAAFGSTGVSYRLGFLAAAAGVSIGLGDDEGSYSTVSLSAQRQFGTRWQGQLATGANFADRRHMAYEFGVTGDQSARRRALITAGDPRLHGADGSTYSPGAGLKDARVTASLAYAMTPRTRAMLFARGTRLSDEAGRSPLVRERNSVASGVALAYGF